MQHEKRPKFFAQASRAKLAGMLLTAAERLNGLRTEPPVALYASRVKNPADRLFQAECAPVRRGDAHAALLSPYYLAGQIRFG